MRFPHGNFLHIVHPISNSSHDSSAQNYGREMTPSENRFFHLTKDLLASFSFGAQGKARSGRRLLRGCAFDQSERGRLILVSLSLLFSLLELHSARPWQKQCSGAELVAAFWAMGILLHTVSL